MERSVETANESEGVRGGTEEEALLSLGSGGHKAIGLQELSVSNAFDEIRRASWAYVETRGFTSLKPPGTSRLVSDIPCVSSPGCMRVKPSQPQSSAVVCHFIFLFFYFFGENI